MPPPGARVSPAGRPARYVAGVTADTAGFLSGEWSIVRQIRDRRAGQDGTFRGHASFVPAGPQAGYSLDYSEHGELRIGGYNGTATRSLRYAACPDGSADVRFADGRPFYRLDLRAGHWKADHPCRADSYQVSVAVCGDDSFTETWQVTGPDKDYEMTATYTRGRA